MTDKTFQAACARRLLQLLAMPERQKWARQRMDGNEPAYPHQREAIALCNLEDHVAGRITAGLVPDGHGGTCKFGAIDLDLPRDGEALLELLVLLRDLQAAATARGLRTFGTFSGRRGFHLVLPLLYPAPWGVVHRALRRVARDVDYDPAELFPTKGKALKLPCGIHGATGAWSVALPDLSGWSEAQLEGLANALQRDLDAATLGEAREPDWQAQAALLEAVQATGPQELEEAAGEATVPDLERLAEGEHPACITALVTQGPRPDSDLNTQNLNLARYCAAAGLEAGEADAMAIALWEAAPIGYTRKDQAAALRNFRQSLKKAQESEDTTYRFRCSDMVAGGPKEARALVSQGRCKGEDCPCWPWGPGRPEPSSDSSPVEPPRKVAAAAAPPAQEGDRHGRRLWRALLDVHANGLPPVLSLALAAAEELPDDPHPVPPGPSTLADALAEQELLAAALGPDAEQVVTAAVLLSPAAFNAQSTDDWERWAQAIAAGPAPAEDVWRAHLERLADVALRVEAAALGQDLTTEALEGTTGPADALAIAGQRVAQLQRTATPDLAPACVHLESLVADLLAAQAPTVPVTHPGLRKVLGGGFRPGQLVAAGGPPGCGKTTWALQVADEAAAAGVPVVFLSLEMTRAQLMLASLSRLSGVDGRDLQRGLTAASREAALLDKALDAYAGLSERLYLVEGGPQHTPGRLQALVGQVRHQQGLGPEAPVLVICDYLQLMSLGADGEGSMPETLRVGALATALKQLARACGCTVIALSDVTKEAMKEAESGGRIGPGVFRDSARVLHACDVALVVQSGTVPATKQRAAMNLLELALQEPGLSPERQLLLEGALRPLEHPGDTYSRLTLLKNRGGNGSGEIWSLYRRHLSQYQPVLPGERSEEVANAPIC